MNMYLQNNIKGGEKKVVQEDNDIDKNTIVLYVPKWDFTIIPLAIA